MICYIPTKNRPHTTTYRLFEDVGIKVIHFIEPQEISSYKVENKINIGENDRGMTFVRNYMLQYAKDNNHKWVIMCDDDINQFGKVINSKCQKTDASIWHEILEKSKKLPFAAFGISYRPFAWSEKKPYSINSKLFASAMLLNTEKISWKYEDGMKEDWKMLISCVIRTSGIIKFNKLFFNAPAMGTNQGGLEKEYKDKKDQAELLVMMRKYGEYAKVVKVKRGKEIRIDIKSIAKKYNKKIL